jgi:hypothetical protein
MVAKEVAVRVSYRGTYSNELHPLNILVKITPVVVFNIIIGADLSELQLLNMF